jgi:phytoene synthase
VTPRVPADAAVEQAFDVCEAITREQAKNFAYGIRLLRRPERRALSAVYALARRIDDIGDGSDPVEQRLDGLGQVRAALVAMGADAAAAGGPALAGDPLLAGDPALAGDPVLLAVAAAARRYPLPLDAFEELVAGCAMDVTGTRYQTFDDLVGYCRHVAGTIGRLSLGVFGCHADRRTASALADDLGVALQLTNILRDVVEDRAMGRVYLPAADAKACGVDDDLTGPPDALAALVVMEAARAEEWYERGLALLPLLDGRSRACVAAMAGIYRQLLATIRSDPLAVTRGRLSLPGRTKVWVAVRSLAGAAS